MSFEWVTPNKSIMSETSEEVHLFPKIVMQAFCSKPPTVLSITLVPADADVPPFGDDHQNLLGSSVPGQRTHFCSASLTWENYGLY